MCRCEWRPPGRCVGAPGAGVGDMCMGCVSMDGMGVMGGMGVDELRCGGCG